MPRFLARLVPVALLAGLLAVALAARAAGPAAAAPPAPSQLEVHFIDVGQGDSIFVRSPSGKTVLIDAGNIEAGEVVDQYLTHLGIGALDLVIASHPHLDHMGGMQEVLEHHRPAAYLDPGYAHPLENYDQLLDWLDGANVPVKVARAGRTITLEPGVTLELLAPQDPLFSGTRSDANSNSVVGRLVFEQVSFLFTGDSEDETEKRLLDSGANLASTVLKVAHHGGRYSTSDTFLRRVAPQFAVISCGQINGYGHPSPQALERLTARDAKVFRTDRDGDVIARTDGRTIRWETTGDRSAKLDEPGGRRSLNRRDTRSGADRGKQDDRALKRATEAVTPSATSVVDLDHATADELAALPSIGDGLARQIVAYREKYGPYADVDTLLKIRGIGRGTVERLRPRLVVVVPAEAPAATPQVPVATSRVAVVPTPTATTEALAAPRPTAQPGLAFRRTARVVVAAQPEEHAATGGRLLAAPTRARVNLNLASAVAIAGAAHLTAARAALLVDDRAAHGAFHAMPELARIPGYSALERAALVACCTVRVDLNRATEQDLVALGFTREEAAAISLRRRAAPFVSIDDLEEIHALTPERRARFLPLLTAKPEGHED